MQITLKQSEIEVALKQYIVAQGINLRGKTVDLTFTAGRKETGILAELDINDAVRPVGEAINYPSLARDSQMLGGVEAVLTPAEPEVPQEPNPVEREDALVPEPQVVEAEANPAPAAKAPSLFG